MIQEQVNILLRFRLEKEDGTIQYGSLVKSGKWIKPVIYLFSAIIYLLITLTVGIFLWNQGLAVGFPGVVSHIGSGPANQQFQNPFLQLMVTIAAIMFIF